MLAHPDAPGLWIKFAKKGKGLVSVTKQQALDVALCYGWIDGQAARYDEAYFLMRFTPRRPRSGWSQVNCALAETLIAEGGMRPAGVRRSMRPRPMGVGRLLTRRRARRRCPTTFKRRLPLIRRPQRASSR